MLCFMMYSGIMAVIAQWFKPWLGDLFEWEAELLLIYDNMIPTFVVATFDYNWP